VQNALVTTSLLLALLASCVSTPAAPSETPATPAAVEPAPAVSAPAVKPQAARIPLPVAVKSFNAAGQPAGTVTTSYNPQGLLVQQQAYDSAGKLLSTRIGAASDQGWRVIESLPSGTVVSIEDRVLGAHGELLSVTKRNAREVALSVVEYQYDASGRLAATQTRSGDGRLRTRTVYTYDAHGNNVKTEVFDASGTLNTVYERQFESGRVVVEKGYDASGVLVELIKTTWKGGRKLSQETTTPVSRLLEYSYDAGDAPVAVVKSVGGQVVERQTFEYQ
jgi:hypothetical protein